MLRILIWAVSKDTEFLSDAINILESQHNGIEIIGKAVGENISHLDKEVEVILVIGAKDFGMDKITQVARQLKLPEEKLLSDWIVCIPGFELEKYRRLQRSRLSIFSRQCFGGCISNMLGLPFRSPFVNLFLNDDDFLKFLRAPHIYLEEEPHFEKLTSKSVEAPDGYPLLSLGNIYLNMMHYKEVDDAIAKWNERKHRINWYNLLVIVPTENEKILEQFDALPYGKKVCFVPFKSELDSAWYINREIQSNKKFWDVINHFGMGKPFYYDPFDMLLYGKKTPLIDM